MQYFVWACNFIEWHIQYKAFAILGVRDSLANVVRSFHLLRSSNVVPCGICGGAQVDVGVDGLRDSPSIAGNRSRTLCACCACACGHLRSLRPTCPWVCQASCLHYQVQMVPKQEHPSEFLVKKQWYIPIASFLRNRWL